MSFSLLHAWCKKVSAQQIVCHTLRLYERHKAVMFLSGFLILNVRDSENLGKDTNFIE